MSETVLTIEEAARNLSAVVEKVHAHGDAAALLVKSGRPVARIVPVSAEWNGREDLVAFLRRWRVEHPEPDEKLADDIEASRNAVRSPLDPWA